LIGDTGRGAQPLVESAQTTNTTADRLYARMREASLYRRIVAPASNFLHLGLVRRVTTV
jgi:hypothetical protein